ncbi:PilZ domain-containing protein [Agaribacterium sp. ZY112]|uniref:PilZ domain-containing protein n=1 Tax=Agaribacterium sp. ZY112 TaxID=3233574 RepID=UPI0035252C6E
MSGFRRFGRKPTVGAIRLEHEAIGELVAETQDVSESGLFVRGDQFRDHLNVGDKVDATIKEIPHKMKVVRVTGEGAGLAYI